MKTTVVLGLIFVLSALTQTAIAQDCPCGPPTMSPLMRQLLIPQEFAGADFRPACRAHDRCYEIPGTNRKICDQRFYCDVVAICDQSSHPEACKRLAKTMYRAERLFGHKSYLIRQHIIHPRRVFWH